MDEYEEICGVSYDHTWRPGDTECRECGADLAHWNEDEEDDEEDEEDDEDDWLYEMTLARRARRRAFWLKLLRLMRWQ